MRHLNPAARGSTMARGAGGRWPPVSLLVQSSRESLTARAPSGNDGPCVTRDLRPVSHRGRSGRKPPADQWPASPVVGGCLHIPWVVTIRTPRGSAGPSTTGHCLRARSTVKEGSFVRSARSGRGSGRLRIAQTNVLGSPVRRSRRRRHTNSTRPIRPRARYRAREPRPLKREPAGPCRRAT